MTNKIAVTEEQVKPSANSRTLIGKVLSSKMDKTIVVQVERLVKHKLYGKYLREYSKMYVHDAENTCREGDVVRIKESRPLSKLKRWVLVESIRQTEREIEAPKSEENAA